MKKNSNKIEFLRGFACGANILDSEAAKTWESVREGMTETGAKTIEAGGYYAGCDAGLAWANRNARH